MTVYIYMYIYIYVYIYIYIYILSLEIFLYKVVILYTYNNGTFHKEFRDTFRILISEVFPKICSCNGIERMVMGERAVWYV